MSTTAMLAYLSAAPGDVAWAATLHRDLERCLSLADVEGRVFWEAEDVAPGRVVAGALQEGLDQARCFLLVVSAEALADRRVTDLWQSFHHLAQRDPGRRLIPVVVEEAPLPPFLDGIRAVSFDPRHADDYRRGVGELLAALLELGETPELPADLEVPPIPEKRLPAEVRKLLVNWLTPVMRRPPVVLRGMADALGLPGGAFLNQPSAACTASNAIVLATGKDDPVLAALRLVDQLEENLRGIESEDRLRQLDGRAPARNSRHRR